LFLLDDDDDDDDAETNDKEEEDIIVVVGSREVYRACVCVYLSLNVFTLNKSDGISPPGKSIIPHYKRRGFYL